MYDITKSHRQVINIAIQMLKSLHREPFLPFPITCSDLVVDEVLDLVFLENDLPHNKNLIPLKDSILLPSYFPFSLIDYLW